MTVQVRDLLPEDKPHRLPVWQEYLAAYQTALTMRTGWVRNEMEH
jgi:hypothetical protein